MQPLLKYLALLAFFLPALSLAVTALAPVEFGLEPVVKSLAVRQDMELDLRDIDLGGLLDLIKPILDLLNPTTFKNVATILRNAAALLSDENTKLLVSVVGMLGDILTPELIDMVKDLLDAAKVIFGNLGQIISALLRWLFGGSGGDGGDDGGDDGDDGGDDGGDDDDGGSGGIKWPDLGGDDDDGGDGGSDSPDNIDGGDGGDDDGIDWDFGGSDDGGDSGSGGDDSSGDIGGDDISGDDGGLGGDDSSGDTGGEDGGENPPEFDSAGVRADPVAAASFAIFAGALGVIMAL